VASINSIAGQQIGQNINNAGAATASGYAGLTNSLSGGITGITGLLDYQKQQAQAAARAANPDWAIGGS
jgi:hypothetical protein